MDEEIYDGSDTELGEAKPDEGSSPDEGQKKEEQKVPLSRLREEIQKRKELEEKVKTSDLSKDKLRELLVEIESDKQKEEKEAEEKLNKEIDELKVIDPTLNEDDLLKIIEKYGFSDVNKAFSFYQDLHKGQTPVIKPKIPKGTKTDDKVEDEGVDISKFKTARSAAIAHFKKLGGK